MANVTAKTSSNIFYKARCEAATHNEQLSSREGAADYMSIDRGRLYRIESGIAIPYPEEIRLMADLYNAPELENYFCRTMCPLGCEMPKVELANLDRLTVRTLSVFRKIGKNLKFLREQNGKTQGELAVLFGIEQKTISSWECGSRKPPIGTIVSLAKLYRVSLDDLVLTDMRPPIPVYALNLAYLRKKHGMTQQEISELLGYSGKQGYNAIETGKVKPTIDTLEKLADFFGVTMDQIVKQDLSQEVSK